MQTSTDYLYADFRDALWNLVLATAQRSPRNWSLVRSGFIPRWESDTSWSWTPVQVVDTQYLVGYLVDQWNTSEKTWPEFRALLEAVRSSDDVTYALLTDVVGGPIDEQQHLHWLANYIRNFFFDYFDATGPSLWGSNAEVFDRLYRLTEMSIRTRTRRVAYWAPIYNLAIERSAVEQLTSIIAIREPDPLSMVKLAGPLIHDPNTLASRFPRYFMHMIEELPLKGPEATVDRNVFLRCIAAIRLKVGGDARVNEVFLYPEPGYARTFTQGSGSGAGFGEGAWAAFLYGNKSQISQSDVDGIRLLWQRVPHLEQHFPVPLRRFLFTSDRREVEDRLIDASIGLEGLLLADRQTESAVLFALRGAWLLAESDQDRVGWNARLSQIYNLRSRVVHANSRALAKLSPGELRGATTSAVEALRSMLRHLADTQIRPKEWEAIVKSAPLGAERSVQRALPPTPTQEPSDEP